MLRTWCVAEGKNTFPKPAAVDDSIMSSAQGMIPFLPLHIVYTYVLNLSLNGRKNSSTLVMMEKKMLPCIHGDGCSIENPQNQWSLFSIFFSYNNCCIIIQFHHAIASFPIHVERSCTSLGVTIITIRHSVLQISVIQVGIVLPDLCRGVVD